MYSANQHSVTSSYTMNSCCTSILFLLIGQQISEGIPTVKVIQGNIEGYLSESYKGKIFAAFEGIPFAKPPVGVLRFKDPLPAEKWDGIFFANKSSMCGQVAKSKFLGSEDCLHLNVYVPKETVDSNDNMDVVIHIHGGAFQKGSALTKALPDYVMDKDVILVTINYRLGAVGFLSTHDKLVPGNMGLKDQNLAMKWIKNNIKSFGGNLDSITLTGASAGAMSVHYHFVSPLSVGLFNRAYSFSGTAMNPRALEKEPLAMAKKFSKKLKCPIDSTKRMVECLREQPMEKLFRTKLLFRPTIEKGNSYQFLPEHPYKLIKEGKFMDVPWITTNVADEAFFLLNGIYKERRALEVLGRWTTAGSELLELDHTVSEEDILDTLEKIKIEYFGNENLTEEKALDRLNRVLSDRHFFVGSDLILRSQALKMKSPIYYYISKFVPEDHIDCGGKPGTPSHCTDVKLLFKASTNPIKLKPQEEKMMFLFTESLEHFARTGIPKMGDVKWLPIDLLKNTLNVLRIESPDNIKMVEESQLIDRKFWQSLPIKENDKIY